MRQTPVYEVSLKCQATMQRPPAHELFYQIMVKEANKENKSDGAKSSRKKTHQHPGLNLLSTETWD